MIHICFDGTSTESPREIALDLDYRAACQLLGEVYTHTRAYAQYIQKLGRGETVSGEEKAEAMKALAAQLEGVRLKSEAFDALIEYRAMQMRLNWVYKVRRASPKPEWLTSLMRMCAGVSYEQTRAQVLSRRSG